MDHSSLIKHFESLTSGELRECIEIARRILERRNHAAEQCKQKGASHE